MSSENKWQLAVIFLHGKSSMKICINQHQHVMISEENYIEKLPFIIDEDSSLVKFIIGQVLHSFLIGKCTSDDISFKWFWKTMRICLLLLLFPDTQIHEANKQTKQKKYQQNLNYVCRQQLAFEKKKNIDASPWQIWSVTIPTCKSVPTFLRYLVFTNNICTDI